MKKIMIVSGFILLCFLVSTPQAREISWKKFSIPLDTEWQVKNKDKYKSSRLVLESGQQGISSIIKISAKPLTGKPVTDYQAWLKNYAGQWASMKFSNAGISEKSPYTVLGHENCPMAEGRNSTTNIYQFLPFIEGNVYSVILNLTPHSGTGLPEFAVTMLQGISFDNHGGRAALPAAVPVEDESDRTGAREDNDFRPQPDLDKSFTPDQIQALEGHVSSVTGFCESGDRRGLAKSMLPRQQAVMKKAIESVSSQELDRFGQALKSRRIKAVGRDLVEYEITDGEHTYAVSFIRVDGKWYLYHF